MQSNHAMPTAALTTDAARIPVLASLSSAPPNDRSATNSETVKPIPATQPGADHVSERQPFGKAPEPEANTESGCQHDPERFPHDQPDDDPPGDRARQRVFHRRGFQVQARRWRARRSE